MAKFLRKTICLPNKFVFGIIKLGVWVYCTMGFKVKYDNEKTKNLKGPYIILGAHEGYLDVTFMALAFRKITMNVVVTEHYLRNKALKPFFGPLGLIAKLQFRSDLRAIADMIKVIKMGGVLAIFPAGQTSVAGKPANVPDGIVSLVRKLNVPVVSYVCEGGYFARNRVANYVNYGAKVNVKTDILLMPEDMEKLSNDEIYDVIYKGIYYDEFERAKTHPVKLKRQDRAWNYENIITKCPNCLNERTVKRNGITLTCKKCHNSAEVSTDMQLIPADGKVGFLRNISDYYDYQSREFICEASEANYTLSTQTEVKYYNDSGELVLGGVGNITLDHEKLHFEGVIDNKPDEFDVKIMPMAGLVCDFDTYFEVYTSEWGPVLCYPTDPKYIVKFKIIVEHYYRVLNNLK